MAECRGDGEALWLESNTWRISANWMTFLRVYSNKNDTFSNFLFSDNIFHTVLEETVTHHLLYEEHICLAPLTDVSQLEGC